MGLQVDRVWGPSQQKLPHLSTSLSPYLDALKGYMLTNIINYLKLGPFKCKLRGFRFSDLLLWTAPSSGMWHRIVWQKVCWRFGEKFFTLQDQTASHTMSKQQAEIRVDSYFLRNYWVFGLCPSSGIVKTRKHDVSETGSVSVLRWGGKTSTQFGPLQSEDLNHWSPRNSIPKTRRYVPPKRR
jgi:hypothetical protein